MVEVKLSMSLFSYPENTSLSEGLDVRGNLLRFFWLNSGTDRQPVWGGEKKMKCESCQCNFNATGNITGNESYCKVQTQKLKSECRHNWNVLHTEENS